MFSNIAALAALFTIPVTALTSAQWRSQSIYQVLTDRFGNPSAGTTACSNLGNYCGGTWQGIIDHLDYIQGMGFTAIWISPVVENIPASDFTSDGQSYHGYWAQNIYEVNPSFGSKADLKSLSKALHDKGMYLMVDVVTNHMAYDGCGTCVDYSTFTPFNSQSYFHPFCLIDYSNPTSVQQCWEGDNTVALADLRTEDANVQTIWNDWIKDLVANYSIDGLRVDSMQQVNQGFWQPWLNAVGEEIYAVGEVFNGGPNYTCGYQGYLPGVMNYPAQIQATQAFQSGGNMQALASTINDVKNDCQDSTLLGSFLENHDNPRFPSFTSDMALDKNAIGFTMLQDGIPIIYNGQEQHFNGGSTPNNREDIWRSGYSKTSPLYTYIQRLNAIRSWVMQKDSTYLTYKAYPTYTDTHTITIRKGYNFPVISTFTNVGSSGSNYQITLSSGATGFTAGQSVTELLTCSTFITDGSGNLYPTMKNGAPAVFYPTSALSGSSLCPGSSTTMTTVSQPSSTGSSCSIPVKFNEKVTTVYGDTIKLAGSISQLGSWNPANAIVLSASQYTASNPLWSVSVNLPAGTSFQYKFIHVYANGTTAWEADPNRSYTVTNTCGSAPTISDSWQG